MRIISQDKRFDINYATNDLSVGGCQYVAKEGYASINTMEHQIGLYSSKEKALKVMEIIRETFSEDDLNRLKAIAQNRQDRELLFTQYFYMPQDDEL